MKSQTQRKLTSFILGRTEGLTRLELLIFITVIGGLSVIAGFIFGRLEQRLTTLEQSIETADQRRTSFETAIDEELAESDRRLTSIEQIFDEIARASPGIARNRVAEAQALLTAVRTGAEVYRFDYGEYPDNPLALFSEDYIDADPSRVAPNFLLSGTSTGAVATGIAGSPAAGRQCSITYGEVSIDCN